MYNILPIHDQWAATYISKVGCSTVAIQNICYYNNIDIKNYGIYHYEHIHYIHEARINEPIGDRHVVGIFRNPVERFISAWKGKQVGMPHLTANEVINLMLSEKRKYGEIQNLHYREQCKQYDIGAADLYVELKDYNEFCNLYNIPIITVNKNPNLNYKQEAILTDDDIALIKDFYQKDYEYIESIRKSGKLYISN